ncbi:MAG: DUF922 domain-containing protein [Bacteroidia bacterium]
MIRILSLLPFLLLLGEFQTPKQKLEIETVQSKNDTIFWAKEMKLTRADFHAPEPRRTPYAGYSTTVILMDYEVESQQKKLIQAKFNIRAGFNKKKSWISESSRSNPDRILMHEQVHFDISELTARRLRVSLEKNRFSANFRKEIAQIYEDQIEKGQEMQEKYDRETKHGLDREKQKQWELKVSQLLEEEV